MENNVSQNNANKSILIIEDEIQLREEVSEVLAFEGYFTFQATTGEEGFDLALKHQPDIILCDIMLPGIDGYETFERIRSHPATRVIPVIFMTALADRTQVRTGMDLGVDDYITKPFTSKELLNSITARFHKSLAARKDKDTEMGLLRRNIITHLPHELRTPLNGIIGFGSLLKDHAATLSQREIEEIGNSIHGSGERLHELIKKYMLYIQLHLREIDCDRPEQLSHMKEIAEVTVQRLAKKYNRLNDVIVDLKDGIPSIGMEDFELLFREIVENAMKFSEKGSQVQITGGPDKDFYKIEFHDNGIGFPPEMANTIGAFMQFDRGKNEQQGAGLGLVIAKRITELVNGRFAIDFTRKQGTTIRVEIPLAGKRTTKK